MGRTDRPKGILKTQDPSKKVIPLTQDLNYYFQKGSYYHRKNKLSKALIFLKKAIEIEPDSAKSHYRLACLLSQSSRLREANRVFKHLVNNLDPGLTECYYLMAFNYGLMDDMDKARHYLQKYLQTSPDGEMAEEARDLLEVMEENVPESHISVFSLQENEALEQLLSTLECRSLKEKFRDSKFNAFLLRALYQGSNSLKEKIILLCGTVKSDAAVLLLKGFVANPWVRERLRQLALCELKKIMPQGRVRIFLGGQIVEEVLADYQLTAPVWRAEWQDVLDRVYSCMSRSDCYRDKYFEDARAIWLDFINEIYPHMPKIIKPETWAAGLEYCLARFHLLNLTQDYLAQLYGVSVSSVSRNYKQIDKHLKVEQRTFRKMIALLAYQEHED